jgi:hypothetical protein
MTAAAAAKATFANPDINARLVPIVRGVCASQRAPGPPNSRGGFPAPRGLYILRPSNRRSSGLSPGDGLTGNYYGPEARFWEWVFGIHVVLQFNDFPLSVVNEVVERIKDGTITEYVCDPTAARLVKVASDKTGVPSASSG